MNAWKAYHNAVAQVSRPRDRDAEELAQVTAALLRADCEAARSDAVEQARRLWTRCGVNACHDESGMPDSLKNTLVTQASNMLRAWEKAAAGNPAAIETLVEVNRQVLSGLQGAVRQRPSGHAFQPRVRQVA